jgi:uncharacterized OB-fold protein
VSEDWLLSRELEPSADDDTLGRLYAAAAEGRLVLPFCPACGLALELQQRVCDACATTGADWRAVEPRGTVHSVTVVHRLEPGLVRAGHPYPVADIELASGHRLVLTSVGPSSKPPAIGDAVSIGFRRLGEVAIPAYHSAVPPSGELEEPQ